MKRLLPFLIVLPLAALTSCSHASKKPKENPAVASEIEETFKQRWVEKRSGELMAAGLRPDIARQQAIEEFRDRYGYTHAAGK